MEVNHAKKESLSFERSHCLGIAVHEFAAYTGMRVLINPPEMTRR